MHTEDPVITGLRNIYFRGFNKLRWQDYKEINKIRDICYYKQSKRQTDRKTMRVENKNRRPVNRRFSNESIIYEQIGIKS